SRPQVPDPAGGVRDEEGVGVRLLSEVHVEHGVPRSERVPDLDRTVVEERPFPRRREIRVTIYEVADEARSDVAEALHLLPRGPGDRRDGYRVGGEPPDGVVGPVDRVEDEGPIPLPLHPPRLLAHNRVREVSPLEERER